MSDLKTQHPLLMVPHVLTFGVVIYSNGPRPVIDSEALRAELIRQCAPGDGVSAVSVVSHGVYEEPPAAAATR